jgi:HSP20 family protein
MAIERWSPFAEMRRLDDVFNRMWRGGLSQVAETPEAWSIPLDVTRSGDDVVVKASIPGVDKKDIDVTIEESVLSIRAQVEEEKEEKDNGYLLRERRSGSFYRAVQLPDSVDAEKAESNYKDGVLTVRLPKQEEKKARKLTVGVA